MVLFQECFDVAAFSAITGFVFGGYKRSRNAFDHFIALNKHEMFRHPREAQVTI
jgi:hypothetical protein